MRRCLSSQAARFWAASSAARAGASVILVGKGYCGTRSIAYTFATYYDAEGRELETPPYRPAQLTFLARAMSRGPVLCSLHRLPDDIKARLHKIPPNVPLVFDRWSVDPYRDNFEVTTHTGNTIRGLGAVRVLSARRETTVSGLYVAGHKASREKVARAVSGGGNINCTWALSSAVLAGRAAAKAARDCVRRLRRERST